MIAKPRRRVTRKDVAELAGVSGTVVSDVLNRRDSVRVSDKTRKRVLEAAKQLDYHPHGVARRLVKGKTLTISFAIYDLDTIVFQPWSRILLGISKAADAHQYSVDLATTNTSRSAQGHFFYRKKMNEGITDGFLIYDSQMSDEEIGDVVASGFPVVLLDRKLEGKTIPRVCNDYMYSVKQVVDVIHSLGHRHWAFVTYDNMGPGFYNYTVMREAVKRLWQEQGEDSPERVLSVPPQEAISIVGHVKDFLERYPDTTAFLCWTDGAAARVNSALLKLGKRVPDEISVVGMNNDLYCSYLTPALTSVDIRRELIGEYAAQMLIQMVEGQELLVHERKVESRLVIRDSLRRAPERIENVVACNE